MEEHQELLYDYFASELSKSQEKRLADWLEQSPENVDEFVRQAFVHRQLSEVMANQKSQGETLPGLPLLSRDIPLLESPDDSSAFSFRGTFPKLNLLLGIALMVAIASVVSYRYDRNNDSNITPKAYTAQQNVASTSGPSQNPSSQPELLVTGSKSYKIVKPDGVAKLTSTHDCKWSENATAATEVGSSLSPGDLLVLNQGEIEITYNTGATVRLKAPASYTVSQANRGFLKQGEVSVYVPEPAIGFLIDTPASRVVDLGTEFGLSVNESGDTNIKVLNGEVEAESRRPFLTIREPRRKLFEGDSLKLSPPVTASFRTDFDTPHALEIFDIVRPDPATCLLDPEAGLLTLRTRIGSISGERNDNSNVIVVPVPDCDFEAVLKVKQFKPVKRRANHVSLAALDDQDRIYRVSYWLDLDRRRGFTSTKEENAIHSSVRSEDGSKEHLFDMEDRPFRLRLVRKGNTISTYWGEASGPWFSNGEVSSQHKLRFVGFFAAEGNWKEGADEQADCVIDSFELKLLSPIP